MERPHVYLLYIILLASYCISMDKPLKMATQSYMISKKEEIKISETLQTHTQTPLAHMPHN